MGVWLGSVIFFFFQKNPSQKKCFLFEGVKVTDCFKKNPNKIKKKRFLLWGGWGVRVGARVSDCFTMNPNPKKFFFSFCGVGGWGSVGGRGLE